MPEFLSEASVAEFFDTSKSTVRRWVEKGVLPNPVTLGGLKRWHIDDLRSAARRGLDAAMSRPVRSTDPDEVVARLIKNGPQKQKNGHTSPRRRVA